ncbi:MAG TPA: prepilin-type N-terminal cleavage/methylation domain-containing protein [Pyrinomonadaceae bacterium]
MVKRPENSRERSSQNGFTMIEMVIALVILFVAVMGIFAAITYATKYNHGNSQRSQASAVMQREIELLRSAKFTPTVVSTTTYHQHGLPDCPGEIDDDTGSRDLTGGVKEPEYRCGIDGTVYEVRITVDDDPSVDDVQVFPWPQPSPLPSPAPPVARMKEITIEVIPVSPEGQTTAGGQTWVTGNPVRAVFRRVRAN